MKGIRKSSTRPAAHPALGLDALVARLDDHCLELLALSTEVLLQARLVRHLVSVFIAKLLMCVKGLLAARGAHLGLQHEPLVAGTLRRGLQLCLGRKELMVLPRPR